MIRDLLAIIALAALVLFVAWQVLGLLTVDISDRPRMCDGLTAQDCTAAAQDAVAAITGGW